jgi:NitT/TauT family transport system permease protein
MTQVGPSLLRSTGDLGSPLRTVMAHAARMLMLGRHVLLPLGLAATFLAVWEFGTRAAHVSRMIVVPPSDVWNVIHESFPILLQQSVPTVVEIVTGFVLASVIGIVVGVGIVLSRRLRQALYPHVLIFQLIPKVALAPLFIVWFGVGSTSRLALAVFIAFFPVVISTATGLMSADRDIIRMAAAATASPWQIFFHVRVPYALPHVFAGLKVALTMAIIGVIVGEFVTAQAGLGYIIMMASSAAETPLVFAAIALLCAAGLLLYGAVALAEVAIERRLGVTITTGEF